MEIDAAAAAAKGRHRRSLSISALFHLHHRRQDLAADPSTSPEKVSPSKWIRSKHQSNENNHQSAAAETRGSKCRSRMGRHRRHASDLTYDPLSYAHNFESDEAGEDLESPMKNSFMARLKAGEKMEGKESPAAAAAARRRKSFDDLITAAASNNIAPAVDKL